MLYNLHFFSSKCCLFHNATFFGFCITHILNTECAKIWKKIRRQKVNSRIRLCALWSPALNQRRVDKRFVYFGHFFFTFKTCITHTFQLQLHFATWLVWLDEPSRCGNKTFYTVCTPTFRILLVHCLPTVHADCLQTLYCI